MGGYPLPVDIPSVACSSPVYDVCGMSLNKSLKEVTENSLGEIVKAKLMKGDTKEIIDRHVTSLIPILESSVRELPNQPDSCNQSSVFHRYEGRPRSSRVAAKVSGEKCRQLQEEGLVTVSTH